MGTRADFYVGRGENAEWLGSIAWDGHPESVMEGLGTRPLDTEDLFRHAVGLFLADRDDATFPGDGWPWPWEDSRTTDYAYAYAGGEVWCSCFGQEWFDPVLPEPEQHGDGKTAVFPDMGPKASAPPGSKRSGVLLFTIPRGGGK